MKRYCRLLVSLLFIISLVVSLASVASASEMKTAIGTVNSRGGLRLREEASASSRILDTARDGDTVVIISRCGEWYKVNYNLTVGYMHSDFLTVKEHKAVDLGTAAVDVPFAGLRQGPSTSTHAITQLAAGETVSVLGFHSGWYKVKSGSAVGYIRSDLLALQEKPSGNFGGSLRSLTEAEAIQPFPETESVGQQLAAYAQTFVGYPYVYGGKDPSGFDCSGFMQYLYAHFGYRINRTATAQLADGYSVSPDEIQPGDIIYFGYGNTATHVGMYIGDDRFVHAENSRTGVVITPLSTSTYAWRVLCIHRIAA